jgi:hypothetical protein
MVHYFMCAALLLAADGRDAAVKPAGDASPAAARQLAPQVAALVRQLDDRQLSARDEAERKLLALGSDVLALLPALSERTPAEVAMRVARVQQKLLRSRALAAAEPGLVTLKAAGLSLDAAMQSLEKQTGNRIVDHREAFGETSTDVKLTADFEKTPYWRAMDALLDQGGLTLYAFTGRPGAYIVNRPAGAAPRAAKAWYAGAFRFQPLRFEAARDLRNESAASLKLFMEVSWEPRLQPFAIVQTLSQLSAADSAGKTLAVASNAQPEASVRQGVSAAELEIPLPLPDRSVAALSLLKGKVVALVPGPAEDFRFTDLPLAARNTPPRRVEQRKAATTVVVDHVRRNNEAWEVAVRVKFESPGAALESHRSWIFDNQAYFEAADQQRITPGGIEQTLQSADEFGVNYYFDLKDSPQKLTFVYRTPIVVLEIPLEYEFRDLPLP